MDSNICHFIPYHKDYHSIHTIHFVLETNPQIYAALKSESVYKLYYVRTGSGRIHTRGAVHPLSAGQIFFTFPAEPFCIESAENFSYMYISFIGSRANMMMEKLKISNMNFIFDGDESVYNFWKAGFSVNEALADWISESILLYTFAFLGDRILNFSADRKQDNAAFQIKKYVDDNFTHTDFSLESISKALSYNKKYISSVFKKNFGVGIAAYVNTIRIQHACTMMQQGFTSVNDIATCCGYADPQYFSRVFKEKMGMTPGLYINRYKKSL